MLSPECEILDDVLLQYFEASASSATAAPSSPIDEQLSIIEEQLEQEVPSDETIITKPRLSLSKVIQNPQFSEAQKAILHSISAPIRDIHYEYSAHSQHHEKAYNSLHHLFELEAQKLQLLTTFRSVQSERESDTAENKRHIDRLAYLKAECERINKEIAETEPWLRAIEDKLKSSAKTRVQLYHQSTVLDKEITPLA